MGGTLIILITSLFMNAGAIRIVTGSRSMERIVMNSVIASATGGLFVFGYEMYHKEFKVLFVQSSRSVEYKTVDII